MQTNKQNIAMRDGFGKGLLELGAHNPKVVALTADLGESLKMNGFSEKYPQRFFEIGIAEQNMAGIAAGLALEGYIPFAGTFSCFQPMRNLDQVRTSICIMNANVKLVSSHGSFSFPADGVQIQAFEDVAIMRTLPNMRVLVPADWQQAQLMTQWAAELDGPVYLRIGRSAASVLSESDLIDKNVFTQPEFGRAQWLRRGGDAAIVATGYMVANALEAASQLAEEGIHVSVLNMHTIKPLDIDTIVELSNYTKHIFTVEELQVAGGLGGAVAEVLAQQPSHARLKMIGIEDKFGDTASTQAELWELHGLMPQQIAQTVRNHIH